MTNDAKKSKFKKKIIFDSLAVLFIALTPFLYKAYDYLPADPEATISFLGFTIDRNGFVDLSTYIWFLTVKIIPFFLLIIWFFTSKDWWYHILLIPIAMYAFQLFEAFYSDDQYVDTQNILWLLPVCMVIIPFVYLIRVKLYDKHVHGIDLEAMDAELKHYQEKERQRNELNSAAKNQYANTEDNSTLETYKNKQDGTLKQFQHSIQNWFHFKH